MATPVTRQEVEDFLYLEADLLDSWQLPKWFELFTDPCRYLVPSASLPPGADPATSLFYISDGHVRLRERVIRLMKRTAHAEFPHSKTRHMFTNVRLHPSDEDGTIVATCTFLTHRTKDGVVDQFIGTSRYVLRMIEGSLRISEKRCELDAENLREQGRLSILL